jgi:hypothetical protein
MINKTPLPADVRMRLEVWVEAMLIKWPSPSSRLAAEQVIESVEGVLTGQILPPPRGESKPWESFAVKEKEDVLEGF